jgi:hypothetical protein
LTGRRVVAALLRTDAVRERCSRAGIDQARLFAAVDDPRFLSFEECERQVASDAGGGAVVPLPLDSALLPVFSAIIERDGHLGASPVELLRDILRADAALAKLVAPHGLTAESLT